MLASRVPLPKRGNQLSTDKDVYEDYAEMMMGTLAVQLGGSSRAQVLAALKAKFPI